MDAQIQWIISALTLEVSHESPLGRLKITASYREATYAPPEWCLSWRFKKSQDLSIYAGSIGGLKSKEAVLNRAQEILENLCLGQHIKDFQKLMYGYQTLDNTPKENPIVLMH